MRRWRRPAGGAGFALGFLSLPTLFLQWGWFGTLAGALWFGLLFFAGITSSLAMGQPVMAFLEDELKTPRSRAALAFGLATFVLGFVCVWLYPGGSFDELDFWTGTFSLVAVAGPGLSPATPRPPTAGSPSGPGARRAHRPRGGPPPGCSCSSGWCSPAGCPPPRVRW